MKIENIKEGDVLVDFDQNGVGYVRVLKVCPIMIKVRSETGAEFRAYPHIYSHKTTEYPDGV